MENSTRVSTHLGMLRRVSEEERVLTSVMPERRSPVASARMLARSIARLCSIVVILRFVRACSGVHGVMRIRWRPNRMGRDRLTTTDSFRRLRLSGLFLRGVQTGPLTLRTARRVCTPRASVRRVWTPRAGVAGVRVCGGRGAAQRGQRRQAAQRPCLRHHPGG